MSSMGGQVTYLGFGAYHAAKFALEGCRETLASELAPLGVRVMIVEPGVFRTQFSSNMYCPRDPGLPGDARATRRRMVDGIAGTEPNDPAKGAAAIVKVLDTENPPLRLLLGGDAVDALREHHEALLADMVTWETLSRSTAMS